MFLFTSSVISYLVMFRLNELGVKQFKRLIVTQPTGKVSKFLKFFFNKDNLYGWIRDEWYRTYDVSFVNTNIMLQIQRHESELREFIDGDLVTKGICTFPPQGHKPLTTEVKPFKLTNPKPRRIPTPEKIPVMKTHKPVPQSTYIPPPESETFEINKETLKLRAEKKVQEADRMKFSCSNTEKSLKTKLVIKQILEEREAKLDHVKVKPRPFPSSIMAHSQPAKLNTAAILREGARVQKATEVENKRLAELEAGQKDDGEFERWQDEVKQQYEIELAAETKRKHLESKLSYEDAIIARQNYIQDTKDKVSQIREEYDKMMIDYFLRKEEEKKNMRKLVVEVMKGHDNTREAKAKLQQMKQKIVQAVEKEKQELMSKALEEAEREMQQKVELIQQIRAMESVPVIRTKFVDPAETSGQGLLAEMSVAELRERLSLMKIANEEAKQRRRREIAAAKEAKEQLLAETLEAINQYKYKRNPSDSRKTSSQQPHTVRKCKNFNDEKLSELEQELKAKQKARAQMKANDESRKLKMNSSTSRHEPLSKETAIQTLLRTNAS